MFELNDSLCILQTCLLAQVNRYRNCADPPAGEFPFEDSCPVRLNVDALIEEFFELFLFWDVTMRALLIDEVTETTC